ncbi:septation ring formation regulator EzrA [Erysipelothrix rhusiopathiae]|uniref:septation ring formation regulator EzrA n=1 Tax=Erysipelothrix rhusiopathiae TaxID=1648 RepID=UPI000210B7C0|nr:septation ring formation regulator EzrA [Erysipelothrix rhusiopathiae]AGN23740.1 septation ring formation regulator EzrA [Erysipelothrix rhusiopathiae SY1027]AMS11486.1 septation ring formation regulator EzrA [Erysipelothrix rhusiopathiae]AOO67985.1 septation ring formation regulator EzrA [Erysipelothrix rhusiopathiae]AWU41169.1 septation ring formation regulator EzrA [Erysipelothrix rhusiopathiae]MDE8283250.1 septation ring formation regulator EzrA [Erysipelothrix rhusiopathiae]
MNFQMILKLMNDYKYIIAVVLVLLIIGVFVYIRMAKKRRLNKAFETLEVRYNELMSIPVLFKINKANGLAKLNPDVEKKVSECKAEFSEINARQEEISDALADSEDALAFGKLKEASKHLSLLDELIAESMEQTISLNDNLEMLLEQETRQRMEITALKDRFRELKKNAIENTSGLGDAFPTIEDQIKEIEQNFSIFEEWMYASDFMKAQEISEETRVSIDDLETKITEIPKLYEHAKGLIPQLLDEVSKLYQGVRQNGVFVEHLEVPKNIGVLSEILKDDLINIGQGEIEKSRTSLKESQKRLEQLALSIQKEDKAQREVDSLSEEVFENLEFLVDSIEKMCKDAHKVETRFNFDGYTENVGVFSQRIQEFSESGVKVSRMIEEEKIPASTILISLQELGQDVSMLKDEYLVMNEKVERANADEVRATKQLLKLHLIINDVQVRIQKRSLPSISDKYASDLERAYKYTDQVKEMLGQDVIDVKLLNATVDEAIDYIYKLHNNVNNLVGVVDMCENAIVYANKFRAFVPDIDAELTRAELSFNSGDYTQSLTTIINSIDRYRPNTAYEEMIRDNAKSAR